MKRSAPPQKFLIPEHNRLAEQIAAENPSLSDEEIHQRARAYVIAEIQVFTCKEWQPMLLDLNARRNYRGYLSNVNPGIANEFYAAAFRLHSSIDDDVENLPDILVATGDIILRDINFALNRRS